MADGLIYPSVLAEVESQVGATVDGPSGRGGGALEEYLQLGRTLAAFASHFVGLVSISCFTVVFVPERLLSMLLLIGRS